MANTFIQLNDTPSDYTGHSLKFVRVSANNSLSFSTVDLSTMVDVQADGAYAPKVGQALTWTAQGNWKPVSIDPYSAGNGLSKNAGTFDVIATGGLVANSSGVYIQDIANVAGTYGNATHVPTIVVNSKGQITGVTETTFTPAQATTITNDFVGNVLGTSGQIHVTGGTGNNSNATINLVATGVTAATYGNATHIPQITVDSYGRIQNVDLIEGTGLGGAGNANVGLGFSKFDVAGQTTISAEKSEDTITFEAGSGMTITTDASGDKVIFSADVSSISGTINQGDLSDVSTTGITNGQVLRWVAANSAFEPYTITDQTGISLTDLSGSTGINYDNTSGEISLADTGVIAKTYGNAVNVPQITVDAQGRITNISNVSQAMSGVTPGIYGSANAIPQVTVDQYGRITSVSTVSSASHIQSLSWNSTNSKLTLSGANTVDLSTLKQNVFSAITNGSNTLAPDSANDTLNIVGGFGIDVDVNPSTDTITITNTVTNEASGVTAGTYGTANTMPRFTVDTRGRITSVSNVSLPNQLQNISKTGHTLKLSNSGGTVDLSEYENQVTQTFMRISDTQNSPIVADTAADTLYIKGGAGINVVAHSGNDTIVITNTAFEQPSGVVAGSYGSNTTIPSFTVDSTGKVTSAGEFDVSALNQQLSFNPTNNILSLSGGGTVDLSTLSDDDHYAFSTISVPGQNNIVADRKQDTLTFVGGAGINITTDSGTDTITITATGGGGGGGNADLTSFSVVEGTPNGNGNLSYNNTTGVFTFRPADLSSFAGSQTLSLNESSNVITISDSGSSVDLTNVLANSGIVGPQGPQGIQGLQGNAGVNGNDGADGVSVTSATINSDNLILTLSNASTIDAGNVRGPKGDTGAAGPTGPQGNIGLTGPQGPQGIQGDGNAGISSATVTANNLILTLADGNTVNAGNVKGPQGDQGDAGVGITSVSIVSSNLVLNYSNTSSQDVGNIRGPQGVQGPEGVHVSSAAINGDNLEITLSNSTVLVAGNVRGPQGAQGIQGNVGSQGPAGTNGTNGTDGTNVSSATVNGSGNLILTLSDASTIDAGNVRGADGSVDQTLSLAGNVITISGSGSTVDLTTLLGSYHTTNTDAQTLSLAGNTLTISGSGSSVDLSSFAGGGSGGIADLSGNVLADLGDVSSTSPTDGQALVWDNANSTWKPGTVAASGGIELTDLSGGTGINYNNTTGEIALNTSGVSAGTYGSSTLVPRITVDATGRITSVSTQAVSGGGGGGGSGATVERFKLNYSSSGSLASTSNLTTGIASATIDSASGGDMTITFNGYNFPPASIMIYAYVYSSNKYTLTPFESTMALREIAGGGTAGSPTLFDGASTPSIKLRLREAETGASRGFGTTTHAWIQFTMYD